MIARTAEDVLYRTPEDFHDAAGLLAAGHSVELVASLCFLSLEDVAAVSTDGHAPFVPLPAEIAQRAAEIRKGWSEKERASRTFGGRDEWQIPGIAGDLRADVADACD